MVRRWRRASFAAPALTLLRHAESTLESARRACPRCSPSKRAVFARARKSRALAGFRSPACLTTQASARCRARRTPSARGSCESRCAPAPTLRCAAPPRARRSSRAVAAEIDLAGRLSYLGLAFHGAASRAHETARVVKAARARRRIHAVPCSIRSSESVGRFARHSSPRPARRPSLKHCSAKCGSAWVESPRRAIS